MNSAPATPTVIVTCGPASEPIDEVRCITNASTGELGVLLANALHAAGFHVICLKGKGATFTGLLEGTCIDTFTTNQSLLELLQARAFQNVVGVFHAAALCDYRVKRVSSDSGETLSASKLSSRSGSLTLELEPAPKVISSLRSLFPDARIVGWKFELDGDREAALEKGWRQIADNQTDACVVNGRAYGEGFGVCLPPDQIQHVANKLELARWLTAWLPGQYE